MQFITSGSFLFFTGLVGFLTWRLTRRDDHASTTGYFLAGRTLTGGVIAGSLLLTNLSTEQLVGLNGKAFDEGICVMVWEVIAAVALVVMGLFFLPRYLKSGVATMPQYLEQRFDSLTRTITSGVFILAYAVIFLPIVLYTGATGLAKILNVSELTGVQSDETVLWITVWVIGLLGSVYAIFGGLRTVAVSDTINGVGLLIGGVMITIFGLYAVNSEGVFAALSELREAHPEKFNSIGGHSQSVPFPTLFTGVILLHLFYWCTNQQIIQRTLGARTLQEGQKGVMIAGCFKILAPMILVLPGIIAYHLFSGDTLHSDHAYGNLVREVLPDWLAGFFAAVLIGAILSSYNSALNSTATLFSLCIYKNIYNPDAEESQVIRIGKRFSWIVAIAAMTVAPLLARQESIFDYMQRMNGLYFIPMFAVVVVGLLTRRVPAIAAKVALLVGFATIATIYFVPALSKYITQNDPAYALHEYHFLGIVFASLVLLMLVIGRIAPRETPWEQVATGDVDMTPWKFAWPLGLTIVCIVFAIYATFADFSILAK